MSLRLTRLAAQCAPWRLDAVEKNPCFLESYAHLKSILKSYKLEFSPKKSWRGCACCHCNFALKVNDILFYLAGNLLGISSRFDQKSNRFDHLISKNKHLYKKIIVQLSLDANTENNMSSIFRVIAAKLVACILQKKLITGKNIAL